MYATPDQKEALVFSYLKRKEIYGNEQVLMCAASIRRKVCIERG